MPLSALTRTDGPREWKREREERAAPNGKLAASRQLESHKFDAGPSEFQVNVPIPRPLWAGHPCSTAPRAVLALALALAAGSSLSSPLAAAGCLSFYYYFNRNLPSPGRRTHIHTRTH